MSFNPSVVKGGGSATCTIRLTAPAGAQGLEVGISNTHPFVQIATSATIPAGSQAISFNVPIGQVASDSSATVTFSDGTRNLSASIKALKSVSLASVSINPGSVVGGNPATGTIRLTNPAPFGGFTVHLRSSKPFVQVPASFTVPGGSQASSFQVQTIAVSALSSATVFGKAGSQELHASLQVVQNPSVQSLVISPSSVLGSQAVTGTVMLSGVAPPGGTVVHLSSDEGAAQVAPLITVPHGLVSATFSVTTSEVPSKRTAHIAASSAGNAEPVTADLKVLNLELASTSWPKFQGDSRNTGRGHGQGSIGALEWSYQAGRQTSSPIIGHDGTVYASSQDTYFYAFDGISGALKWKILGGADAFAAPAFGSNGLIYLTSPFGFLSAIDSVTGVKKWLYSAPIDEGFSSSPAIGPDGTVYVDSVSGTVFAFDGITGEIKWTFKIDYEFYASPAIGDDGTVYVGGVDGNLYALDGATGAKKWSFNVKGGIYAPAAIDDSGMIYFGSSMGVVHAVNLDTHAEVWSFDTGGIIYGSPAIGIDGTVYIGSYDGNLYALDGVSGAKKWSFTTGGRVLSSPAISSDNTVYFGSEDRNFYALDAATGALKWTFQTDGWITASPAIAADGHIYFGGEDGNIYALGKTAQPVPDVQSISVSPSFLLGTATTTCTVILKGHAPPGGAVVLLSSDKVCAPVPASITLPNGAHSGTFTIHTTNVSSQTLAHITAKVAGFDDQVSAPLTVVTYTPGLAKSAWPKYNANPMNTGVGIGASSTAALKWKVSLPIDTSHGYSNPLIGPDEKIYVGSGFDAYAIDGLTGARTWTFHPGNDNATPGAVGASGQIYFSASNGVFAVKAASGVEIWHNPLPQVGSSRINVGVDGTIFVGSNYASTLYALDGASGATKWTFVGGFRFNSSPAIGADGTVYIGCGNGVLYAVDGATGIEKWRFSAGGTIESSPAIAADGTVYFASEQFDFRGGSFFAVDGFTGTLKWSYQPTPNTSIDSSPILGPDGTAYIVIGNYVHAFNGKTGHIKWKKIPGGGANQSLALASDGTIYVGAADKSLYALDSSSGATKWSYATDGVPYSPIIGTDGTVYFASTDKYFYALGGAPPHHFHEPQSKPKHDASRFGHQLKNQRIHRAA